MTLPTLESLLVEKFPQLKAEISGPWLQLQVTPEDFLFLMERLCKEPSLHLDYLFCLTCVDWKTQLTMVYHLASTQWGHELVVKCSLDRNHPVVPTVSGLWKTAEFHEREVAELFGVDFAGHPDLRNLILPDHWQGYPLRKDYEDPINMIKL